MNFNSQFCIKTQISFIIILDFFYLKAKLRVCTRSLVPELEILSFDSKFCICAQNLLKICIFKTFSFNSQFWLWTQNFNRMSSLSSKFFSKYWVSRFCLWTGNVMLYANTSNSVVKLEKSRLDKHFRLSDQNLLNSKIRIFKTSNHNFVSELKISFLNS